MEPATRDAIVARLAPFERLVEVGIGTRSSVAEALVRGGKRVVATDLRPRDVPPGVEFVRDDVTDPIPSGYEGAGALYALNLPPELHRPARSLARSIDAAFLFTTLGGDEPVVPVSRETIPGDTIYRALERPGPGHNRLEVDGPSADHAG